MPLLKDAWKGVQFYAQCLKIAFGGAYGAVNWISTGLWVLSSAAAKYQPHLSPRLLSVVNWFGGWEILALFFVGIGLIRIILAPFCICQTATEIADKNEKRLNAKIDELNKALEVERDKSKPKLGCSITHVTMTPDGKHLMLSAGFINAGAPSIAQGFRLSIKVGDVHATIVPEVIPENFIIPFGDRRLVIRSQDVLYEKTVRPIVAGELIVGWLSYRLPESFKNLFSAKIELALRFSDYMGQSYICEHDFLASPVMPLYLPGLGSLTPPLRASDMGDPKPEPSSTS